MDQTEKRIIEIIEKNRSRIIAFGDDIYRHAELGYKEIRTAEKFRAFIEPLTQNYTDGLAITGAKAYINRDKRDVFSLALIGELDALRIPNHAFANPETQAAHCCGHHIQLTGVAGAALALTDPEIAQTLGGQLIFMTTPAEEYGELEFKNRLMAEGKIRFGGGKAELIRIGAFDDVDCALASHTDFNGIRVGGGTTNGFVSKIIRIKGKAAHAAGAREEGINALHAASLGLQAVSFNEHTFKDSDAVRIHSIITKGGDLVNIVPDDVVLETLCRAKTLDAIRDAAFKTDRSFRAGARALGARCVIETMPGYLPSIPEQMPEEVVEVIREAAGDRPVEVLTPDVHTPISTDVGDLQHVLPVLTVRTGGCAGGLHQSDFRIEDEDEAYLLTAKLIALSAYRLLKDGARVGRRVKERYRPVFRTREEYTQYLEQFNTVTED